VNHVAVEIAATVKDSALADCGGGYEFAGYAIVGEPFTLPLGTSDELAWRFAVRVWDGEKLKPAAAVLRGKRLPVGNAAPFVTKQCRGVFDTGSGFVGESDPAPMTRRLRRPRERNDRKKEDQDGSRERHAHQLGFVRGGSV
jgi:hypothetical protein